MDRNNILKLKENLNHNMTNQARNIQSQSSLCVDVSNMKSKDSYQWSKPLIHTRNVQIVDILGLRFFKKLNIARSGDFNDFIENLQNMRS